MDSAFASYLDPDRDRTTTYSYDVGPRSGPDFPAPPPPYTFEHDAAKRVFRLRWSANGEVEVFRDQVMRFLVVEPDPDSPGGMTPKLTNGRVTYLRLCREEREIG
jgi:hypothetical protein